MEEICQHANTLHPQIDHKYLELKKCVVQRIYDIEGGVKERPFTRYLTSLGGRESSQVKSKSFPRLMAHRAAPISVSVALGHASANAVRATAGGWSTGSSACLTSPLLSHFFERQKRKAASTIFKVFGMTRPWLEPSTFRL